MGRETVLFKSEEKKSRDEAVAILRQIADKVETGNLSLQQGNESLNLEFPENVTLEIKAEEEAGKKVKRSLEFLRLFSRPLHLGQWHRYKCATQLF